MALGIVARLQLSVLRYGACILGRIAAVYQNLLFRSHGVGVSVGFVRASSKGWCVQQGSNLPGQKSEAP
jgi:hypothetical protein